MSFYQQHFGVHGISHLPSPVYPSAPWYQSQREEDKVSCRQIPKDAPNQVWQGLVLKIYHTEAQTCHDYHCEKSHSSGSFFYVLASCIASLLAVSCLGTTSAVFSNDSNHLVHLISKLISVHSIGMPWCRRFQTAKKDKMAISQQYDAVCSMQRNHFQKDIL